jgi:sugar-specific transcriptional regulator TrmB
MTNNKNTIVEQLRILGLNRDEAKLYLELLRGPSTHLKLAHATGINRTKVYRLADDLEKRSLITKRTDDRGTFLVAADPATLEIAIVNQEEKLKTQRSAFDALLPVLTPIKQGDRSSFIVQTYYGVEGFKQMLWHELKAKDEVLIFGNGTIEELVDDHRWAEKHRAMTLEAGYIVREILNPGGKGESFTENTEFMEKVYHKRIIPTEVVTLAHQVVIYNDVVAIYHWREAQKVGVEIINKDYATMQRQIFGYYWQLAT